MTQNLLPNKSLSLPNAGFTSRCKIFTSSSQVWANLTGAPYRGSENTWTNVMRICTIRILYGDISSDRLKPFYPANIQIVWTTTKLGAPSWCFGSHFEHRSCWEFKSFRALPAKKTNNSSTRLQKIRVFSCCICWNELIRHPTWDTWHGISNSDTFGILFASFE